ncbi:MAG: glycosyltransferase family 39 protein [Lutibacter sp.]|jgi:hypothetical protein
MKNKIPQIIFVLAVLAFIGTILFVWQSPTLKNYSMGNDEYFFYRITMNLPHYATTGEWFIEENAPNKEALQDSEYITGTAYNTKVWIHPLLDNYLAYPIAKLFSDVANQIQWLRLFCVFIIIITFLLFVDIIRKKSNYYVAAIAIFPMIVGRLLLANGIMFYYDLFQWLFFALTLWIIERNPNSKWIYIFAAITVLSKFYSILFLIPIWFYLDYKQSKIKKQVTVMSITLVLIFFMLQAILAHDILYQYHHWIALSGTSSGNLINNVLPNFWGYVYTWGLWLTLPLIFFGSYKIIRKKMEDYYVFASFGLIVLICSLAWGFYPYHVFPIMYAAMFMIPALVYKKGVADENKIIPNYISSKQKM